MQARALADGSPVSTGVPGLDDILSGGYAANRAHLIEGRPGCGKTTLGLQFLLEGLRQGQPGLYITLSESKRELTGVVAQHGWSLDGLDVFELVPPELSLDPKQQQTLFHASEVELGETVRMVLDEAARVRPTRVVFDSLSEVRLLSQGSLRYRRQVLALKNFFLLHNATVLLLDDMTAGADDLDLHSLAHAIIRLEQLAPSYGAERRRLQVVKMRAPATGADTTISSSGAAAYAYSPAWSPMSTGATFLASRPAAACRNWTPSWEAVSTGAPARYWSAPPDQANPRSPSRLRMPPLSAASAP